jgi:nuclear migration protein JNM1
VEVEREITAGSAGPSTLPPAPAGEGSVDDEARDRGKEGKRKSVLPLKEKVDLISELTALRERMGEIDLDAAGSGTGAGSAEEEWEARLQRLAGGPGSGLPASGAGNGNERGSGGDHGVFTGTSASAGAGSTGLPSEGGLKLSELDRRLASLEDLVGPSGEGINPTTTSTPLLTTLSRLDHLVALLTQPRHLDAISRRVKLLLVDLDRAAAASRRPGAAPSSVPDKQSSSVTLSGAEYANLQTLFAVLPRLDPLLPILPPLLARLRSLAVLHAEASEIADGLRTLQSEDKRTGEEVKEMEEVVRNVQAGLAESVLAVQKNWEGVEGRMRSLDERVSKLVARV